MSLRLRIHLIVGVLTLAFVAALLLLQARSLSASVREEVVAAHRVATQLLDRATLLHAAQGPEAMVAFLQGTGRIRSNDVTLLDGQGAVRYTSPPSPYKAGREAPAWFARWIAPELPERSIRYPDGALIVRANASRALLDAWEDFRMLAGAALALLLLASWAVHTLVGRATRPLGQVVDALGTIEQGRLDVTLPALPGREAQALGQAVNRMTAGLRTALEQERRAARAEAELSDSKELARWVDQQIEQERHAIARELHDEFGQSVTAIRAMALSVAQRVGPQDAPSASAARTIADEALRLYDAMHRVIPRLSPLVLDAFGLEAALQDLCDRTEASHPPLRIERGVRLAGPALTPEQAIALYRAVQEGLTNAITHGQAQRIVLTLDAEAERGIRLSLADDGVGLRGAAEPARRGHYGLRWIEERVQALGGTMALRRGTDSGDGAAGSAAPRSDPALSLDGAADRAASGAPPTDDPAAAERPGATLTVWLPSTPQGAPSIPASERNPQ